MARREPSNTGTVKDGDRRATQCLGIATPAYILHDPQGCLLRLKVVPGSRTSAIAGVLGDRLKVKVAAPPEDGKANRAVCALLAAALGVRAQDVVVTQGQTSPEKLVLVRGVTAAIAAERFNR